MSVLYRFAMIIMNSSISLNVYIGEKKECRAEAVAFW